MNGAAAPTSSDRKLVSIAHRREIESWCQAFACSEAELRAAVATVGAATAEVRAFIRRAQAQAQKTPR